MPKPPLTILESRALSKEKNSEKFLVSNLEWPKKFGIWTPPSKKFSWEYSVTEKILKKFEPQIWHDQKKLVPGHPPINSESRAHTKGKNFKNILISNLMWPKKVGAQNPPKPRKIERPQHLVKEKILKNFLPQIWHDQKSWWTDPSPKNSESRVLCKGRNSKNFLTSNLTWPKKVGAQTFTLPKKLKL